MAVIGNSAFAAAIEEHLASISARDIERFARTLHREVRLIGPNGSMIVGYDDAVAAHRGWFAEPGWTFVPSVIWSGERAGGGWALTDVRYDAGGKRDRFLLFLLFVREGDEWKLIYDQNTPLTHP